MASQRNPSRASVSSLVLTAKQKAAQALLRAGQRHTLLVGGSRSGKTTLLVNEIAERAVNFENSRHVILRLRFNAVRPSIALDTLPKVFRLGFPNEPLTHHRTDGYFSLQNGSEIWLGGLDDQERVEKILGKEYVTIFINECSQISYSSTLIALTRLAQVVKGLKQAAYYDLNPTSKGHWTNVLFGDKRDPISRLPLDDPDNYAWMFLNPRDNPHLTKDYLDSLARLPERQRKRFFEGAYIDDLDGALFSYEIIAKSRVSELAVERRNRVVVAVDPSGAASEEDERSDEIGIVVAARGDDGHAYVLADRSLRDAPAVWGRAAVRAYHEFAADHIVAEENFGGEMVRFVIRAADANAPVRVISASRGKALRAEPVSALYEQGLVHHVGRFAVLEDQLCAFTTAGYRGESSPDHADALVFAVTELMLKETAPLLEFYRRQVEERRQADAPGGKDKATSAVLLGAALQTIAAKPQSTEPTILLPPAPVSAVHGLSGTLYMAAADGSFAVTPADAAALVAQGFVPLKKGEKTEGVPIKSASCSASDSGGAACQKAIRTN